MTQMADNNTVTKTDAKSDAKTDTKSNGNGNTEDGAQVMAKVSTTTHKTLKLNAIIDDVGLGDLCAAILTEWANTHPVSVSKS